MLIPPIARYMTPQPWTIRRDAPLDAAAEMMRTHDVRHLPVLDAGKLVGVISDRDVQRFRRFYDPEVGVEDAMSEDVYTVTGDEPIDRVVATMTQRKAGSVVIVDGRGAVAGIFTTIDALRALGDVLERVS